MSSADQNRPGGKSGRRSRKADKQPGPKPDRDAARQIDAAAPPAETSPVAAGAPPDRPPIGFQTIATAYGDYTMKTLEEIRCLVEKLSDVRSLDRAIEIQAEFARQSCTTFIADSRRIGELYGELARQAFKPSRPPPQSP
jgi:hypothetical protein